MLHAASSRLVHNRLCFDLLLSSHVHPLIRGVNYRQTATCFGSSPVDNKALLDSLDHVLQQCASVQQCKQLHAQVILAGVSCSGFLAARIVSVYARFGFHRAAQNVFDSAPFECLSNLLLWNSILRANVSLGFYENALELYVRMRELGVRPDGFTLPLVIRAIRFLGDSRLCKNVHNHVFQIGFQHHIHAVNEMLGMYGRAGLMSDAYRLFDTMTVRTHISWNTMISGYTFNYDCDGARHIFERMDLEGFEPNHVTWTSLLSCYSRCAQYEEVFVLFNEMRMKCAEANAEAVAIYLSVCGELRVLSGGKAIHGYIIKCRMEDYLLVKNALILVYGKCRHRSDAYNLFLEMRKKSIVTWNTLITSYVECGLCDEALSLFSQLEKSNDSTMERPNMISWSAVISGCASQGRGEESLQLFRQMQLARVMPSSVTIASVLSVCADLSVLNFGREVHGYVIRFLMDGNVLVQNGLVNMYAKCGSLKEGHIVFVNMDKKDLISWNSIITGYGMHGQGNKALMIFDEMIQSGIIPDGVTFVAVLSACSHAGLVAEGRWLFNTMIRGFGIAPGMEHYACFVDLLGRAGFLQEAGEIVKSMPMEPNACVWGALLNSCRMHKNKDAAEETASKLINCGSEMTGNYMLLSNIYAANGNWEDSAQVRLATKTKGMKKVVGNSWIEVKKKVYTFSAGNTAKMGFESLYWILEEVALQIETEGSVSSKSFFDKTFDEDDKRLILWAE